MLRFRLISQIGSTVFEHISHGCISIISIIYVSIISCFAHVPIERI